MRSRSWRRAKALVPVLLLLVTVMAMVGFWKSVLVLEIGGLGFEERVSPGDVFVHTYTHSMYDVPVLEKYRIEDGHFRLVHVTAQSDAALDYLGIDRKDEPNVNLKLREFNIPAASTGHHVIRLHDSDVPLGTGEGRDGTIRVELLKVPLVVYFSRLMWR
jgi:hypothetical protein